MARLVFFIARQATAILLAALAYFGVRGLTEGGKERAYQNAEWLFDLERRLNLDLELTIQQAVEGNELLLNLANWIYIFGHWPVIVATLVWLAVTRRDHYYELRNALFLSGAVGLVIFATWAVMPPRLFSAQFVDTVTMRSNAYRVLQPPGLINKYAAVPSLHFGWNLLVGIAWIRATSSRLVRIAGVMMPLAMAFAVVATANHWTADVIVGGAVASTGLLQNDVKTRVSGLATTVSAWFARLRRSLRGSPPDPAPRPTFDSSGGLEPVRNPVAQDDRGSSHHRDGHGAPRRRSMIQSERR